MQAGHEAYFRGRFGAALLAYLRAADLGVEMAQSNAAWMLERGYAVAPSEYAVSLSIHILRRGKRCFSLLGPWHVASLVEGYAVRLGAWGRAWRRGPDGTQDALPARQHRAAAAASLHALLRSDFATRHRHHLHKALRAAP